MELPVVLLRGWVSILLRVSPNGIIKSKGINFGIVDGVSPNEVGSVSEGQYVMFSESPTDKQVTFQNNIYYLIQQHQIVFIEDAVTPP